MKRLLISTTLFLYSLLTFAQFSGSGAGTENDPYLIMNPIQLNQLRNFLNQEGVYFKLMADIDLTEFLEEENPSQGWQPVGTTSAPFKGILDGNGKKISGLWINRANSDYVGFFGNISNATLKNFTVAAKTISGKGYVGGISGKCSSSTFSGIVFSGKIQGSNSCIGGIIGEDYGSNISDIAATVEISSPENNIGGIIGGETDRLSISNCNVLDSKIIGNNFVGGVVGVYNLYNFSSCSLSNCYVHADVTGAEKVGGVCGYVYLYNTSIDNCGFYGSINGVSRVGGLIGDSYSERNSNRSRNLKNCFAIGPVAATGDYAGGLIGYVNNRYVFFNISNSYYSGSVSGKYYIGGLIGENTGGNVSNCYSNSSVSGAKYVGGLIGKNSSSSTLKSSVAINPRVTATEGEVAKVVGYNEGSIGETGTTAENKSYNRTIVISQGVAQETNDNLANGTGVSATTLKLKATYVAMGFDFNDCWEIQETECYPYMKSQTAPPVITSKVISGATTISGKCVDGGTVTLEIDGKTQQMVSSGHEFSFTVSPLQSGHEVRISAKADGKEPSYYTTEVVSFLGKGTEADPYQIYTASDLTQVYRKGYYKLMNDIDLTDYINQYYGSEGWKSIGREGSETIYFDGNGHKVTGLWCNSTRDNTGLFSSFANGYIKNLTVETANDKQVKGGKYTGIIIGKLINGEMTDCKAYGSVADGTPVGGMIGKLEGGKMLRCQTNVTINVTGENSYVGGLVGDLTGEVIECLSNGTLNSSGANSYVGGLVGLNNTGSSVTNSYSNAVTNSSLCAAGVVAYNYGVVDKCYATGNIFSNNYGAGVVGYNDGENAVVKNCVASNYKINVTFESQSAQSGGYGQRIIGGIKNGAPAPEMNNYALKTMQVSVNDVPQKVYDDIMNGTGKTGTELAKTNTYKELSWDFTDTWSITEDESLPLLKNNIAEAISKPEDGPDPWALNNILQGVDQEGLAGSTTVLPIELINEDEIKLCQFDLHLPAGVTVATKSNGKLDALLTERAEDHSISTSQLSNGDYRFIISSLSNDSFTGSSGTLLNITLNISATLNAGSYTLKIQNTELSLPNGNDLKVVKPADMESKLTVKAYTPGDVNNDGSVSVTDVGCTINYILEQVPSVFIFDAADMNGDKTISVTDVGMIINFILNDGAAETRGATENYDYVALPNITLQPIAGGYQLQLEEKASFIGFQFDIALNDGAMINDIKLCSEKDNDHLMTYRQLDNGKWRVICYSPNNSTFSADEGSLLTISTTSNIAICDIRLTTRGFEELAPDSVEATTTGVTNVEGGMMQISVQGKTLCITSDRNNKLRLFTLDGTLCRILNVHQGVNTFDGLRSGIYMIENKKIIIR